MEKVILISIDGMRSDGLKQCKSKFLDELVKKSAYTFDARTVSPSLTLPVHLSMFQSVTPQKHGTLTWDGYVKPEKPIDGLLERIKAEGKKSAMFYSWEYLRDIGRPGSLAFSEYIDISSSEHTDAKLTGSALDYIKLEKPDFAFLYLGETDEKGHSTGWMSDVYLECIKCAMDNVKRVIETLGNEYTVIVTTDHGGHGWGHGSDIPEDMIIPVFCCGDKFAAGEELSNVSILDIAPTIASVMNIPISEEWEGKSVIK